MTNKITPNLWFDDQAEEAANFYVSVFKNAEIQSVNRSPEGAPGATPNVMTVNFRLNGQDFLALNGGPQFKFTEAISFVIDCESQEEVDYYWENLTADGGEEGECSWLKDKFGLSWQVVPRILTEYLNDPDTEKADRVRQAMRQMQKIDIATLQQAYDGRNREREQSESEADRSRNSLRGTSIPLR